MFRCACRDCEEVVLFENHDEAQEFFRVHASRSHEVELLNLEAKTGESQLASVEDDPRSHSAEDE